MKKNSQAYKVWMQESGKLFGYLHQQLFAQLGDNIWEVGFVFKS